MNNVFLFDQDTMICTWHNYLNINDNLIIGKFECKSDFRDNIIIATKKLVNDSLYKPQSSKWTSIKFLKSHLQKCVRRMKSKLAVESASEIMRLDMNHFLRRLPIIIIEDVDLISQLPTTVWLMIAHSKGYKLRDKDVNWLLGVVKALAKCTNRTIINNKKILKYKKEWIETENVIFNSILLRIAYGGMGGDMAMLRNSAVLSYNKDIIDLQIKPVKISNKFLKLESILPVGVDFHVGKNILYQIQDHLKKNNLFVNKKTLKAWMWQTRSGFNKRHKFKNEKNNPLKKYHKEVDNLCLKIVKENYYNLK